MPVHRSPTTPRPRGARQCAQVLDVAPPGLKLVVVADTHGHPHPRAQAIIEQQAPTAILHAGDVGNLEVLRRLQELAPVVAVRGNVDPRSAELPESVRLELRVDGRPALTLLLVHFALHGTRLRREVADLAVVHQARLVVCGHSHVPFMGRDRGVALFNPGSVGPRRFQLPITVGILAVSLEAVRLHHIDCETEQIWQPQSP